jgi:secondary thiamine-phosphate synthase enzyme
MTITVATTQKRQVVDITDKVSREVADFTGVVHLFVLHSAAALATANMDPGTDLDLLDALDQMLPKLNWRHPHDPAHTADHLLATIIGAGVAIPVKAGQLQLGTWQRIVLVEFNGANERQVELTLVASQSGDPSFML